MHREQSPDQPRPEIPAPRRRPLLSRLLKIPALLAVVPVVASCAGGEDSKAAGDDKKPVVLTTFTVLADMTQAIAGDHLQVESITKPGAEIHEYEPTPEDIKKASKADLILENGMNLEAWFEKFTQDSRATKATLSDGVEPISIGEGEAEGKPNPHAWMSPVAAEKYTDNIQKALSELDPDHRKDFEKNASAYKEQLKDIHDQLTSTLHAIPENRRTLLTCEGAFSYLARDAGLKEQYLWAVNSDAEPSAQRVSEVTRDVRANQTPAAFCESTVSDSTMQQVVRSTDAQFGGTLYVDSLSDKNGPVPTYLDLLRYDARVISDGLTGRKHEASH
ncbi:metal ABC transporter substrate-binding protein [Kocuria sp. TGY1127_2]|uniref:metal ABC transporter substrate-binding protein n=1 Tax=Kocuria sp. TGY1127_2 TaxID=2711328 RepID=UPI0015C15F28|nr:metal ABC transporter substrate-binding protein [Kocuria sp. TGY1127_2]